MIRMLYRRRRTPLGIALVAIVLLLLLPRPSLAQRMPFDLPVPLRGITNYDESVPTPESVIGHRIGTRHTTPDQVVDYFDAVASVSDRVILERHGETYEGRPLIHAVVTSPENHGRLESIRLSNVKLVTDPASVSDSDIESMPAIFYAGYSIHGNEATGTEAAILFLYHLAAARGPGIDDALKNTVILLDPMFNPDGRNRFTNWVNRNRGRIATTDSQDREHNEPWPGGRTNHYFFDLNRDWLPAQQIESQGRLALFHSWKPQVLTDHHEMGGNSTFFFQPGVPSRTNPNTPPMNQSLTGRIGEYHARMLDSYGARYYSEEGYDDFYYGKGSTYPDVNGSIGILFEQASSRALKAATVNGELTYAFGVRNHFATSVSSLQAIVEMRPELLRYQRDFYAGVDQFAKEQPLEGYVISFEDARHRGSLFAEILERHQIHFYKPARETELEGTTYGLDNSFFVPLRQTQGRLVKAIMETSSSFTDSLFYDVSSWTLPLAFNLKFAGVSKSRQSLAGSELTSLDLRGAGTVIGGTAAYAYVLNWGEFYLPQLVNRLMDAGVRVQILKEPTTVVVDDRRIALARGALIVPVFQVDVPQDSVHSIIRTEAVRLALTAYAVDTGLTPVGPDLGSESAVALDQPAVAILSGSGQSSSVTGEAWQLLSEHFLLPVSLLDASDTGGADLSRYNVIVVTGSGADVKSLQEWVRAGGTLITLDGGTSWAASSELVNLKRRPFDLDSLLTDFNYSDLGDARGAQSLGGSIVDAVADNTSPILYGFGTRVPFFVRGTTVFDGPSEPGAAVATFASQPELSGYFSSPHRKLLPDGMSIADFRSGRGHIVTFGDDPNFRQFWYGTSSAFVNAVFLGSIL